MVEQTPIRPKNMFGPNPWSGMGFHCRVPNHPARRNERLQRGHSTKGHCPSLRVHTRRQGALAARSGIIPTPKGVKQMCAENPHKFVFRDRHFQVVNGAQLHGFHVIVPI